MYVYIGPSAIHVMGVRSCFLLEQKGNIPFEFESGAQIQVLSGKNHIVPPISKNEMYSWMRLEKT